MYIWGKASFTNGGTIEFRAPVEGRTIVFGNANNGNFPFYSFTLNDDGTISAERRVMGFYSSGTFSAPKPITQSPTPIINLEGFAGNWSCGWNSYAQSYNKAELRNSLAITSVDPKAGTASGEYRGNALPAPWGYSDPQGAFNGPIVGNALRVGDWLELTLSSSGTLRGTRYIENGYKAWVNGACVKGS